jgi:hypothetical protein
MEKVSAELHQFSAPQALPTLLRKDISHMIIGRVSARLDSSKKSRRGLRKKAALKLNWSSETLMRSRAGCVSEVFMITRQNISSHQIPFLTPLKQLNGLSKQRSRKKAKNSREHICISITKGKHERAKLA